MEMIQGLSPKKNPLRGRKSLAVGSARGLLGKRPIELDQDDDEEEEEEEEENDGVKRLKGHQGSPVKNIRLQSPPSKAETTTGRKTRPSMRPGESTDRAATPTADSSPQRAPAPGGQRRLFGGSFYDQPTVTMDWDRSSPAREPRMDADDNDERIHLQDFLNMTSIRFMELTTTKRRHTVAPGTTRESIAASKDDLSLERCVVAGACTVPMLEMYQHVSIPTRH
jgi:kinetochore protein Spc7/SPC105